MDQRDVVPGGGSHGVPRRAPRRPPAPRTPAAAPAARAARLEGVQRAALRLLPPRLAEDQAFYAGAGNWGAFI